MNLYACVCGKTLTLEPGQLLQCCMEAEEILAQQRFRITVRGEGLELRGHCDDFARVARLAEILKPLGVVVASPADRDYEGPWQLETPTNGKETP